MKLHWLVKPTKYVTGFLFTLSLVFLFTLSAHAADTVSSAVYEDTNSDGTIDRIRITMDENATSCTYEAGDWTVNTAGTVNISITGASCTGSDAFIDLAVSADASKTGGATDPVVSYSAAAGTPNSIVLASGNMTDKASQTISDGAAPRIASSTPSASGSAASNVGVSVTFTEPMNTGVGTFSDNNTNGYTGSNVWSNGNMTVTRNHNVWNTGATTITLTSFAASSGTPTALSGNTIAFTVTGGSSFTYPLPEGSMKINGGDPKTNSREVILNFEFTAGVLEVFVTEDPSFTTGVLLPIAQEVPFTLSEGAGMKTLYAALKDASFFGNPITASIEVDPNFVPQLPPAPEGDDVVDNSDVVDVEDRPRTMKPSDEGKIITREPTPAGNLPEGVAVGMLVKIEGSNTVYFVDNDRRRHAFPNAATYWSWFDSFDNIVTIDADRMARIPLGKNMPIRQGTYLIKVQSSPKVYVVERRGVIRWIPTEEAALAIFGPNWAQRVIDLPVAFFTDYQEGASLDGDVLPDGLVTENQRGERFIARDGLNHPLGVSDFMKGNFRDDFVVTDNSVHNPLGDGLFVDGFESGDVSAWVETL